MLRSMSRKNKIDGKLFHKFVKKRLVISYRIK